jgi:hypothetical protein
VIAGAKWRIIGDAASNSVSLILTPIPIWTTDGDIIGKDFFLLPLDGSKSWEFRSPSYTSDVTRVSAQQSAFDVKQHHPLTVSP